MKVWKLEESEAKDRAKWQSSIELGEQKLITQKN